jgi:type VI secretion system secreted protein VgrG
LNIHVPYTQAGRMMAISSVLGEDALLLEQLTVDEAINELFTITAEVKSQRDDLRAGDLIGSSVDFLLKLKDGGTRWWNGFVTDLHQGSLTTRGTRSYLLTVRPTVWRLLQTSDCRIFRGTTAPQIVETLLGEHGITDLELRVTQTQTPLDYSVQWNETDLAYMLRRMQQMGLFCWFEHDQGRHTMIVADHQSGYRDSSEPEVRFTEGSAAQDHINRWNVRYAYTPGKRAGRDWNFLAMQAPHGEQANLNIVPGSTTNELYEYPGRFDDSWSAEQAMKYRIQATETGFETVDAASTVRTLAPGRRFTPHDVAKPANIFAQQVVTAIRHEATNRTYETNGGQPTYANTFAVMPATTPATPHRTIPRPSVVGTQIAMIAGPEGEEIFCDQWGRIKVWFPWDRRAAKDGSDTCWIRVGQPWAGTTWGHQVIPRVGMEALVSYQDGDPDRPFVTALVPDPTNPTPYPLPDNKTRMTFRSNSYKSTGFNEMTFEDATGAENMFFHAQKDHTTRIENDQTLSVGASQSSVVGQNQSITVGQNMTFEAGKSINWTIGGTGAGAAPLMAPFVGMAGITASLLGQALTAAVEPGGQQAGQSSGDPVQSAMSTLSGAADTMMPSLASSLIGLLSQSGIEAQQGVWHGPSPRPDAGTALAAAGNLFGQAVGNLFNLPGMHNHITGTMRTDHCGCAHVEQVGTSKVTHVGSTFATKVGKAWTLIVGQDASTKVGNDWTVAVKHRASIAAGENIMLNAAKDVSVIADDSIVLGATNDITQSAKTVLIHADTITLDTGNASIELDKDGNITLQAAKTITLQAANQIILHGGSASVTVGPGTNLASPPFVDGSKASDFGVFSYVGKKLGALIDLGDEGSWVGKQLDDTWVGHQVGKGFQAFGNYMLHGYTMKDGTTLYPGGTVVHPDGSVDVPMMP